jgi:hypothetical protein
LEPGKEVTYSLFLQAKKPGDGTFRLEYSADEGISGKAEETISIDCFIIGTTRCHKAGAANRLCEKIPTK